ncbi:hypothetical protein DFA_09578 [Cavenderia fasciculata]|uniref:Glutathione S-transferase n=1 Tax=Cavenderia fasciculata TaxID=261658 RepID=F4Q809_CACFS|nr:uncharacterized protein DFA_09578 [Cavenderia fasciculata]EGG15909.1 hypothetical protein DFA_09578 [Cavenderia fasciculata]|eukprot:XP_004352234.1 hypothetical protein DFA_09578 [Cavenderia fasciculata]
MEPATLQPIKLYTVNTPNGSKPWILLKLLDIPFQVIMVNIKAGEQFQDAFVKINPNSKVPAIVDPNQIGEKGEPLTVWESGNILLYIAKTYGKGLYLPDDRLRPQAHYEVLNWLFLQMSTVGPHFGNYYHYKMHAAGENLDYPIKRHFTELRRLFHLFNRQLEKHAFIAGDELSIADIAIYPWSKMIVVIPEFTQAEFPKLFDYHARVGQIQAVKDYVKFDEDIKAVHPHKPFTEEERKVLFFRDR